MYIIRLVATVTVGLGILELLREMALFAGHGNMQPHQRKVAEIMIEAHLTAPGIGDMTLVALTIQLPGMRILRAMAANTGRTQLLRGDIGGMTGVAIEFGMWSGQRKFGIACVIEAGRLPIATVVALLALLPHASGMCVLCFVTTLAILGNFVFHAPGGMTTGAIGTCMRTV